MGSGDRTLRVWDLETGAAMAVLTFDSPVTAVALTPDGWTVIAGDYREGCTSGSGVAGMMMRLTPGTSSHHPTSPRGGKTGPAASSLESADVSAFQGLEWGRGWVLPGLPPRADQILPFQGGLEAAFPGSLQLKAQLGILGFGGL